MSQIVGKFSLLDGDDARSRGFSGKYEVGRYVFQPVRSSLTYRELRWIPVVGVECPFCHGPLVRLDPRDHKSRSRVTHLLKSEGRKHEAVIDDIPRKTHWVVSCKRPCRISFVMPKKGYAHV